MKKFYSLIIACIFPFMAWAQGTAQVDGLEYKLSSDQTAEVSRYVGTSADMVIPGSITYDGTTYTVTGIVDEAFKGNSVVRTAVIAASVDHIGLSAFEECSKLYQVTFEEGSRLETISSSSFATCTNLTKVVFAEDCALTYIGNSAFTACPSIKELKFPSSLRTIDFYAFGECTSLKEFTFGDNAQLTSIEPFAFNSCSALAVVNLPASLTSIADMAFTSCKSLNVINSAIAEPFSIGEAFDYGSKQTLYVPAGTKAKYQAASGWKRFKNIEEKDMAVEGIVTDAAADAAIYDLQGCRVTSPVRGEVYIRDGKKIIF